MWQPPLSTNYLESSALQSVGIKTPRGTCPSEALEKPSGGHSSAQSSCWEGTAGVGQHHSGADIRELAFLFKILVQLLLP